MPTNLEIFTPIWETASPTFQERIPQPSQDNLAQIGVMIAQEDYEAERNEIFDALVNLIGKQKVFSRSLTNPLSMFKKGAMYFGDTYEEAIADIIEGQQDVIGEGDQFKKYKPTVKAAYHRVNREMVYPVTIEQARLSRAFMREGGLASLEQSIIDKMYSSNDLDEYLFTKKTIAQAYGNPKVPLNTGQKLIVPNISENVLDTNSVKAFVMTVKGVMRQMKFAKTVYNPYGITMQTRPEDMCILLKSDFAVIEQVGTLTGAFHPEYMDVNVPIIEVDDFGEGMENVVGVIMDKETLGILDTLRTTKTVENALSLYRNYFYHVHQLYYFSPLTNCVFLVTSE